MPKFLYTAINSKNQELRGSINAPNIKEARDELRHLGLSVLNVEEEQSNTAEQEQDNQKYEFEALDNMGRKIVGRIQENDRYQAFYRLKTEYNFDLISLYKLNTDAQTQATEKKAGLEELEQKFQLEQSASTLSDEEKEIVAQESSSKAIEQEVSKVIAKVEAYLVQFKNEIKADEKQKIISEIDKLKLLKSSSNFEHIKQLTKELLDHIQERKIFYNREKFIKERTNITIEANEMMNRVAQAPDQANQIDAKLASINTKPGLFSNISAKISHLFDESPEITKLKEEVRLRNVSILELSKLYLKSADSEEKNELKDRIKNLYQERSDLKTEIAKLRGQDSLSGELMQTDWSYGVFTITSWLIGFYLVYYFIAFYISSKEIFTDQVPAILHISQTKFLKYFVPLSFLAHILSYLQNKVFPHRVLFTSFATSFFLITSILIIFNF